MHGRLPHEDYRDPAGALVVCYFAAAFLGLVRIDGRIGRSTLGDGLNSSSALECPTVVLVSPTQRAPGPRGWGNLRAMRHFLRDPLDYLIQLRRYGELVRTQVGPFVFHTLYKPSDIRQVLVDQPEQFTKRGVIDDLLPVLGNGLLASEGALWRERRRALSPALGTGALRRLINEMDVVVQSFLDDWQTDRVVHVNDEMMRLALSVVGRALFGVSLGERASALSLAVERVSQLAYRRSKSIVKLPLAAPTPANRAYRQAIKHLRLQVDQIMDTPGPTEFMKQLHQVTGTNRDAQRDEVMTFLLAGHETTATTLTWMLAHLSRGGDVLREARRDALGVAFGEDITLERLEKLRLIDAIASEAMRLYPPGWMLMRRAEQDCAIGGFAVKRNSFISIPVHAIHRHPDYWPNPDLFNPRRFLQPDTPSDPLAYLPFGAGPRRCIGEGFARLEIKLFMVRLLQRFDLEPIGDLPKPMPLTTLRPNGPVYVRIIRRDVD